MCMYSISESNGFSRIAGDFSWNVFLDNGINLPRSVPLMFFSHPQFILSMKTSPVLSCELIDKHYRKYFLTLAPMMSASV